jgi:hypothetical protein
LVTPPLLRLLFSTKPAYADVAVPLEPLVATATNLVDA